MTPPGHITAAIIAVNEAHHLPELFRSLSWVDEIVLVDGGSSDATVSIARRAPRVRCLERPFDNYAAQRNYAADQAQGRWILAIDADERATPGFADEVRRLTSQGSASAWRATIRSRIFGRRFRFSGTQDDRPIRLYDRTQARWHGDVHERLSVAGRVDQIAAPLDHQTLPDLASFLAKMQRYTSLAARAAVADGTSPRLGQRWTGAAREFARRFVFKQGWLDGPEGWAFCALSGLSAWVAADKHRRLWKANLAGRAASP
ncbi:MAG: glycosyltransferase family 2 protein [Planctomycetaceae bacterium]|nr:glycosyltransferase family 2 protein [Planctomycetaceae bacterium]